MRGAVAAALVLATLGGASAQVAQAAQTPAQRRLEEDRKRLYAEDRKEAGEKHKLLGGLSHGTERLAHGEQKAEKLLVEAGLVEKQIEAEEAEGTTGPKLEHLQGLEAKRTAQLSAAEQQLAAERLAQEEQTARREGAIGVREAEIAALEAQIVKDEEEVAEGL